MFEATSFTKSYTVYAIEAEGKWKTKELDLTKCYRECEAICSLLKAEMLTGSFFFYMYIFFSLSLYSPSCHFHSMGHYLHPNQIRLLLIAPKKKHRRVN